MLEQEEKGCHVLLQKCLKSPHGLEDLAFEDVNAFLSKCS